MSVEGELYINLVSKHHRISSGIKNLGPGVRGSRLPMHMRAGPDRGIATECVMAKAEHETFPPQFPQVDSASSETAHGRAGNAETDCVWGCEITDRGGIVYLQDADRVFLIAKRLESGAVETRPEVGVMESSGGEGEGCA